MLADTSEVDRWKMFMLIATLITATCGCWLISHANYLSVRARSREIRKIQLRNMTKRPIGNYDEILEREIERDLYSSDSEFEGCEFQMRHRFEGRCNDASISYSTDDEDSTLRFNSSISTRVTIRKQPKVDIRFPEDAVILKGRGSRSDDSTDRDADRETLPSDHYDLFPDDYPTKPTDIHERP